VETQVTQARPRLGIGGKLVAYWELAHPFPLFIALLDGILFIGIVARGFEPYGALMLLFLLIAKVGITGFVDTFNDYCDQDLDMVAKPKRPIPSLRVTSRETLVVSLVWLALVVGILAFFSVWALLIACGIVIVGSSYNWALKRTPLSFLPLVLGIPAQPVLIAVALDKYDPVLLWAFPLSFLPFLGLHLINTLYDLESDGRFGLHGLAHILGKQKSLLISWVCFFGTWVIFLALSLVLHYNQWIFLPVAAVYPILIGLAAIAYYTDPVPAKLRAIWGLMMLDTGIILLVGWVAAVLLV
jgi:4-hydroxybenzoate polyprenyltransferase